MLNQQVLEDFSELNSNSLNSSVLEVAVFLAALLLSQNLQEVSSELLRRNQQPEALVEAYSELSSSNSNLEPVEVCLQLNNLPSNSLDLAALVVYSVPSPQELVVASLVRSQLSQHQEVDFLEPNLPVKLVVFSGLRLAPVELLEVSLDPKLKLPQAHMARNHNLECQSKVKLQEV